MTRSPTTDVAPTTTEPPTTDADPTTTEPPERPPEARIVETRHQHPEARVVGHIAIKPMRSIHLNRVLSIDARCYPTPWTRDAYEAELSLGSDRLYLVAQLLDNHHPPVSHLEAPGAEPSWGPAARLSPSAPVSHLQAPGAEPAPRPVNNHRPPVIGYGGAAFEKGSAHITTLAVDPDHRGRGIGARLLLALTLAARRRRTSLTLEVASDNLAAHALYRRFGLAPVGIRRGYYTGLGYTGLGLSPDAIVMRADGIHKPDYAHRLVGIAIELDCA